MANVKYDRDKLFPEVRKMVKKLSQSQVNSINAIMDEIEDYALSTNHAAYVMATAWHESKLKPIRETFASTDKQAVSRLNKAYRSKVNTKRCYWCAAPHYFGRGFVQLTWRINYQRMGDDIGVDLVAHPGKALQPKIAAKILVRGMVKGMFTGKALKDYQSYYYMRKIVNGLDKAKLIAKYARQFEAILRDAAVVETKTTDVVAVPTVPTPTHTPQLEASFNEDGSSVTVSIISEPIGLIAKQAFTAPAQGLRTMNTTSKHALKSKTFWGVVSGISTLAIPAVMNLFGYNIDAETSKALGEHGLALLQILMGVFSTGMTLYGRADAKQGIHFIPKIGK